MPLCEQCQENDASVFITQIISGRVTKKSLCMSCAEANGLLSDGGPPTYKLPPELEALGLDSVTLDELQREMGMDPAVELEGLQQEILKLPKDAPSEVTLPESMRVRELADALHARVHQVIYVLMQLGKFTKPNEEIDFATAALVCEQLAVMPRRG